MNICIESHILNYSRRSGVITYAEGLVDGLYKNDDSNQYTLAYYSLHRKASTMQGPSGRNFTKAVVPFPGGDFKFRQRILDDLVLPAFFKKNNINVFHRPDGHSLPNSKNIFKVLTVHDLRTLAIGDQFCVQDNSQYKEALKNSNMCVVVSECTKQDLLKYFQIAENKIKVIYLGAEKRFRKIDEKLVAAVKLKYRINEPYFLSIGSVPRKNIDGIIKAFAQSQRRQDYVLVLTCNMDIEKYKTLAQQHGVLERIMILDNLNDEEIVALYNGCQAFLFPSLYEGFGLPILEAMQCGAPVITSNMSSCPEVAGDAGILVDPKNIGEIADAINQIGSSEHLRAELIQKGFERSKLFNWDHYATEIQKVYQMA